MAKRSVTFYGIGPLVLVPLFVAIGFAFLLSAMDSFPKPFLVAPTPTPGSNVTGTITPTGAPQTAILSLLPSPAPVDGSGLATVEIQIDPGGAQVTAVQVEITYNPALINIEQGSVQNGPFFSNPSNLFTIIDNANGKMFYTWNLASPTDTAPSSPGIVATFRVRQVGTGSANTPLTFQSQTFATSRGGAGSDILQSKVDTSITLNP
jgi:hypothetical protein